MAQSVEEMILSLPRSEQSLVKHLRALIQECLPVAIEKISYGVPFYTRNRMICFIWPPTVSWGPKKEKAKQKGVTLGFCQGKLFANDKGLLLAEGRKQVYCMYFKKLADVNDTDIRALLYEAEMIDASFKKQKKEKHSRN
jgi:hypothetical protein